jgi:predicted MPP superfamily phosphohydrolase
MVQISDLHYSPVVWERYLLQFIGWVNDLKPDVVVVTGDLITGAIDMPTASRRFFRT